MAGTLVIDTLKSSTANPVTFQNTSGTAVGTLCRAWVNFDGTSGSIRASFNVGSVTRNSTGNYTVNFTNSLTDANYSANITTLDSTLNVFMPKTPTYATGSLAFTVINNAGSSVDPLYMNVSVFR